VVYDGRHKRMPLAALRRLRYHGFELDKEVETLDRIPPDLAGAARAALVEAVMTGAARHKDGRTIRQTLERLGELYRRSGGTLTSASGPAVRAALGARLHAITRFEDFVGADLALTIEEFVPAEQRRALDALPSWIDVDGEHCPLAYEIDGERAIVRVRLKEGLARRLRPEDLPTLDRPLAFSVSQGKHAAVRAASLQELRTELSAGRRIGPRQSVRARKHRRRT
jgi:hypothetical protein